MPQNYTYNQLNQTTIQITWKKLYEDIYSVFSLSPKLNHENFFKNILPESLFNILLDNPGNKRNAAKKSMIDRVFCACDGANRRFRITKEYLSNLNTSYSDPLLTNPMTEECYTFSTSPLLKTIADNWSKLMDFSKETDIEDNLIDILGNIPLGDELCISDRIGELVKNKNYSMALACMSLIACTVFSWCSTSQSQELAEENNQLYRLILPPLPNEELSTSLQKAKNLIEADSADIEKIIGLLKRASKNYMERGEAEYLMYQCHLKSGNYKEARKHLESAIKCKYTPALRTSNQNKAQKLIDEARRIYKNPETDTSSAISKCCQNCMNILQLSPSVDSFLRGEACFYIYKYSLLGKYILPPGETPYQYLEQSHTYGYKDATPAWKEYNSFRLTPRIDHSLSSQITGICFTNTSNELTDLFEKSIPKEWESLKPLSKLTLTSDLNNVQYAKYYLFDNDFSCNIRDTLDILQALKDDIKILTSVEIEIYLRAVEDDVRSLIDTALSHMPNGLIPVYIVDDAKWPAQHLLSSHPLFYPIRAISNDDDNITLNLVVLGDSPVTDWIVREAFWMMSFRNENIRTEITIIAPNGKAIEARIKNICPGMVLDKVNIKDVSLSTITSISADYDTAEFPAALTKILEQPNTYFYFVVTSNDDYLNLSLAKKVRELQIRNSINHRRKDSFNELPPLAFLCRDSYTSWISKGLVIEGEDLGNQWFNTWSLIPFGNYSQRYNWDSINGGTFELLSKCLHLQYSGVQPPTINTLAKSEYEDQIKPYLYDYYSRQYNRDSSYSEALSMPYRIFQFSGRHNKKIIPLCWSILEDTVYSTVAGLAELAKQLDYLETDTRREAEYHAMSIWEHNRWIRWMLSRGWLPMSPDDSVFAWKCGNKRQQLFVARLHPCLCSYDELSLLSETLKKECGIKKDFFSLDRLSIISTKNLLQLKWIYPNITRIKEEER